MLIQHACLTWWNLCSSTVLCMVLGSLVTITSRIFETILRTGSSLFSHWLPPPLHTYADIMHFPTTHGLCCGYMWKKIISKLFQPSSKSAWNNFISTRENVPEIIPNYFTGLLQLTNIFQHVHCCWNILELLQRWNNYFSFRRSYMWNKTPVNLRYSLKIYVIYSPQFLPHLHKFRMQVPQSITESRKQIWNTGFLLSYPKYIPGLFQDFPGLHKYFPGPCHSPQQRVNIKTNSSYLLYI